jgi:hypothetical protein
MAEADVELERQKAARKAEKRAQKLAAGPSLGLFGFMGAALFGSPDDDLLDGSFD